MSLINELDAILPQTQCGACGFKGCRPYAQALASKQAAINLCPPGGMETLKALAKRLRVDWRPYEASIAAQYRQASVAKIDEKTCIGCTKCIQACPVDAIFGAGKQLHHVIANECTGCGLCLDPCPVDCIELISLEAPLYDKDTARRRFEAKQQRLDKVARLEQKTYQDHTLEAKKDYIAAALLRVKQK
ncbi:MAG: RnfABCDGE type electron transport complex subunit B [Gammaproteobacteria bacterium]|nr:RnfABCDGE type electron transport complex subunit B [Gammaproteobacteria bacterium]